VLELERPTRTALARQSREMAQPRLLAEPTELQHASRTGRAPLRKDRGRSDSEMDWAMGFGHRGSRWTYLILR
jgi:hypothetical protein